MQLSYEAKKLPGEAYVIVAVFDDPEPFESEEHHWPSQKLELLDIQDDFTQYQKSGKPQSRLRPRSRR